MLSTKRTNEGRRSVVARSGFTSPCRNRATPASGVPLESEKVDQSSGDSFVGESSRESTTRRLRMSLQTVFEKLVLQSADADGSGQLHLRASLRQVCDDARRSGLRAEQLLVLIKDVWSAVPAGIARVPSVHGDERLNYVISTCVDEYYGHRAGNHEATP